MKPDTSAGRALAEFFARIPRASQRQMDEACPRIWNRVALESPAPVDAVRHDSSRSARYSYRAAHATAVAAVLLLGAGVGYRELLSRRAATQTTLEVVNGTVQRSMAQDPVAVGARVDRGEVVSSQDGSVVALADGSRLEMRPRTEVRMEAADDGTRIRLNRGSVIVTAAKRRTGHLYVQTRDVTVSVVGTVFLVNAEEAGSRVAVIQGEVRVVEQRGSVQKSAAWRAGRDKSPDGTAFRQRTDFVESSCGGTSRSAAAGDDLSRTGCPAQIRRRIDQARVWLGAHGSGVPRKRWTVELAICQRCVGARGPLVLSGDRAAGTLCRAWCAGLFVDCVCVWDSERIRLRCAQLGPRGSGWTRWIRDRSGRRQSRNGHARTVERNAADAAGRSLQARAAPGIPGRSGAMRSSLGKEGRSSRKRWVRRACLRGSSSATDEGCSRAGAGYPNWLATWARPSTTSTWLLVSSTFRSSTRLNSVESTTTNSSFHPSAALREEHVAMEQRPAACPWRPTPPARCLPHSRNSWAFGYRRERCPSRRS